VEQVGAVIIGTSEVQMVEADGVEQGRALGRLGWGIKRIGRELGLARDTVRKYLDEATAVGLQERPEVRRAGRGLAA
jgi:predicted acetyltransferase